jgi:hypothetical protein
MNKIDVPGFAILETGNIRDLYAGSYDIKNYKNLFGTKNIHLYIEGISCAF